MTKKPMPPMADLIAQTPGAQSREQAQASLKARRDRLLATPPDTADDFTAAEPSPDTDAFARGFFQRLIHNETQNNAPPKGVKPRLVVDNNDDDPEPPKAS